jgi:hypothetical protein
MAVAAVAAGGSCMMRAKSPDDRKDYMAGELIVTYFPYTLLEESDLKRLCLYVSRFRLLQIDPQADLGLPSELRARDFIQPLSPVEEGSILERIRLALASYRQLGALRPEGGNLHSFGAFALQDDPEGSTSRLRAHLRGSRRESSPKDRSLVDAAVFLLLAHEVDREHLELERHLGGVRVLEAEFAEALGLPDEHGEAPEAVEETGAYDLEQLRSTQVAQRLRAWTCLYLAGEGEASAVPLTTSAAVMEEIWEQLPSHLVNRCPAASAAMLGVRRLCRLPDPGALPAAEVVALREKLERAGILPRWRQAVATTLGALQASEPAGLEEVEVAAAALFEHWPVGRSADLEVQVTCYPRLPAITAFALASGLQSPAAGLLDPKGRNGVSLLLAVKR